MPDKTAVIYKIINTFTIFSLLAPYRIRHTRPKPAFVIRPASRDPKDIPEIV